ncbi:Tim44 domain-containing protein [Ancylobacter sp. SL191]|uniref:Tim44 domain-containing protein n=1 Tax=Ancylobacter sp. SL191 TaxID=2995166 RepID=UPI00227027C9|nr:TIM44-like domain-containing protein [Ancylobacter sp. SL191]WAC25700.1 TIM44-like domain-containing protein [Ancylobacter sp. SL191]
MKSPRSRSAMLRLAVATLFLGAGLMVATDFAEARVGRSGSFGSRGSKTWSTPAPTPTAPSAQPMQRSATPQGQTAPSAAARAPGAQPGGFFNRGGFMGGLMGGLLGAGLFGLLMGSGFFSGLGSLSGILGLLLQVALIFIVVRLVMGWLRSRNQPSYAGGARPDPAAPLQRDALNGAGGTGAPQGAPAAAATGPARFGFGTGPRGRPIKLDGGDFDSFERLLGEVQTAYGRDDRAALTERLTPEMMGYIGEELDDLAKNGLENRLTDVKLLQGDLSEAWNEDGRDYATVAMRYQLKDVTLDKATGRVVQSDADRLEQAVEFWTFTRTPGGAWQLSAIQQG